MRVATWIVCSLFLGVILACSSPYKRWWYDLPASDPADWVACDIRVGDERVRFRIYEWLFDPGPCSRTGSADRLPRPTTIAENRFDFSPSGFDFPDVNYELRVYEYPDSNLVGLDPLQAESAIAARFKVDTSWITSSDRSTLHYYPVPLPMTSKAERVIRNGRRWLYVVWLQSDVPQNVLREIYATSLSERTFLAFECDYTIEAVANLSKLEARRTICRRLFETLEIAPI